MKKLVVAGMLLITTYAYACRIETLIINGKIINCTVCGSVTSCS